MSLAIPITLNPGSHSEVYTTDTWTEMVVVLEPAAGGENRLSFGNDGGILIVPGQPLRVHLSPRTRVTVRTSSQAQVEWSFVFTPLSFIDAALALLPAAAYRR